MREQILQYLRERDGFVSGQELGERFGVSRTSVWKAIQRLTEMGYGIEAVRNRGYRLVSEPDLLSEARVSECLHTEWTGQPVLVFDSVDSTNSEAKRLAEDGAADGLGVVGDELSAGRGRRGRGWASTRGEGIFLSLLLRPDIAPASASMLTLVMGLAVRDALAEACSGADVPKDGTENAVWIKWPNDIVIDGKKVCGILTEMSAEPDCVHYVVIGVGINVHNETFPEEAAQTAVSLFQQTGQHFCRAELVAAVLRRFEDYYAVFLKTSDLSGLMDAYNAHLINRGREVRILNAPADATDRGTARGINARGELLIDTAEGTRGISSGEVSVRGVYDYV